MSAYPTKPLHGGPDRTPAEDDLARRIFAMIADKAEVPLAEVADDTSLDDLGIDSLDMVELIFELEEAFDIAIPDTVDVADRFRGLSTAGSAVALVQHLLTERIRER